MTSRIINEIPRENAADYRRVLNRQALPKLKKERCMVETTVFHQGDKHIVQIGRFLEPQKRIMPPPHWSAMRVKKLVDNQNRKYKHTREQITRDLQRMMSRGINGLTHVEYVRLTPRVGGKNEMDDDNLWSCFKPVRDALCAYALWGDECVIHLRDIGNADGQLKRMGVTWTYRQQKCESNPRLYGFQLILHCAPRSTEQ